MNPELLKHITPEQVDAELSRRSFLHFVKNAWPILEPSQPFIRGVHHDAIAEHLEAVTKGQIRRLLVNIPPRYGKSILISVLWPMWEWIKTPSKRYLCTSFKESLGQELQVKAKKVFDSDWYQLHFAQPNGIGGKEGLTRDTLDIFENVKTGYRRMAVYESAMGFGGDRLIVDDPHNIEDAMSDDKRKKDIELFDKGLSTRVNGPHAAIICVMQRLHENDLAGHLLKKGGYEHLCLPNEYDPKRSKVTCIGWTDPRTDENQLLWPMGMSADSTEERKKSLGTFGYAGQYQQSPVSAEGGLLNPAWFKAWTSSTVPQNFDQQLISADFTFKSSSTSDFVVLQHWGRSEGRYYLLDQDRFRGDFTVTLRRFISFVEKHPEATTKVIELAANGEAIMSQLRQSIPGMIGVKPKESKEARVSAIAPWVESGNVFIPEAATWKEDFLHECAMFPKGDFDDCVDAMSQALMRFDKIRNGGIRYGRHSVW